MLGVENQRLLDEAFRAARKAVALHGEKEQHRKLIHTIESTYRNLKLTVPQEIGDD